MQRVNILNIIYLVYIEPKWQRFSYVWIQIIIWIWNIWNELHVSWTHMLNLLGEVTYFYSHRPKEKHQSGCFKVWNHSCTCVKMWCLPVFVRSFCVSRAQFFDCIWITFQLVTVSDFCLWFTFIFLLKETTVNCFVPRFRTLMFQYNWAPVQTSQCTKDTWTDIWVQARLGPTGVHSSGRAINQTPKAPADGRKADQIWWINLLLFTNLLHQAGF